MLSIQIRWHTIYSTCCDIFGKRNGDSKTDEAVVNLKTIEVVSVIVCESLSFCVKIQLEDHYESISTYGIVHMWYYVIKVKHSSLDKGFLTEILAPETFKYKVLTKC